ncbi:transcriptional attenuator, LytR family [Geodermatophilus obscurus]|uniref:Transcriptional attenuator, LytR family n=1 Tax=Geodermatophilus obscurus TaxID=1861 RepID=A0A1M7UTP0_9ACTN|nr:LCP family protein [Geodermatophilus obscurus]SHN86304.1 transcriptional attenuator, LytR family [Geodermatophilus obscurus]
MTAPHDPDAGQGSPGRRRPFPGRRAWTRIGLAVLVLLLVAVSVDIALLAGRVDEVAVELGADDSDGRTWVLVGLDSRDRLPGGADPAAFGTPEAVPGTRADAVVVVHQTDAGTRVLSLPRDLLVIRDERRTRLTLTWQGGPRETVDVLCSIGIAADHLVTVDFAGFAEVVDAAGGLTVDVPVPVRDPGAGLELPRAGVQHVDGRTALALVRSRHPQHLVDGAWTPVPVDPDGRASAAGTVLSALVDAVRGSLVRPWRLQAVGWATTGALTVDPGTSVTDLAALAGADLSTVEVVPSDHRDGAVPVALPTAGTRAAIEAAGLTCGG